MKTSIKLLVMALAMTTASSAFAVRIVDEPNRKAVGHVTWKKQNTADARALSREDIPAGESMLFFVREVDNDELQTSLNIAINDRFQVSLQPGNFSRVNSCAGLNDLSAEITGAKTNDLLYRAQRYDLQERGAYFFFVSVDDNGVGNIAPMAHEEALRYIEQHKMQYQTHQISRVVMNTCEAPIAPPPIVSIRPVTPPPPPVEPVAKVPVSIELEVLFDTDKSFVKPQYRAEVERVATFMRQHPHVTAVIEGHTDSRASDDYNIGLSQRRVNAVMKILVEEFGIDQRRLSAVGYGEARPRATNATPEGRQLNRRVVATFSGL